MKIVPEVETIIVAAVGNFNPAIFTPHWLFANGLIEENEADTAEVSVIHPELSVFQTTWFHITVEAERISLVSRDAIGIRIFDLMLKLLIDIIPHSPANAFGINYITHFRVKNMNVLNQLGDLLGPKEPWGDWGKQLESKAPKDHPFHRFSRDSRIGGLRAIGMIENVRQDGLAGHYAVQLEPSMKYIPGIYIEINDHYEVKKNLNSIGSAALIEVVKDKFDLSIGKSRSISEHFMKICEDYGYSA